MGVTNWTAAPSTALWYGEVIVDKEGEDTTYEYGYSNDEDPNVHDLVPDGWTELESKLERIPGR